MDKKHCIGCHDNFYNNRQNCCGGDCWSIPEAKLIWRKEVHIDQTPPWNQKAARFPNCYHKQGYVYVDPKRTR